MVHQLERSVALRLKQLNMIVIYKYSSHPRSAVTGVFQAVFGRAELKSTVIG